MNTTIVTNACAVGVVDDTTASLMDAATGKNVCSSAVTATAPNTCVANVSDNPAAYVPDNNPIIVYEAVPGREPVGVQLRMDPERAPAERCTTVVVVVPNDQLTTENDPLIPGLRRRVPGTHRSVVHDLNCFRCSNRDHLESSVMLTLVDFYVGVGLTTSLTAVLILGELAGIGTLLLPYIIQTLGWPGFIYLLILAIVTIYNSVFLGKCWKIMEENMNSIISSECRTPMSFMAFQSFGRKQSKVTTACVFTCLYSVSSVYLLLLGQTFGRLLTTTQLFETTAEGYKWIFVGVLLVLYNRYLGAPKNSTLAACSMMIVTMAAGVCIIAQMVEEGFPEDDFTMRSALRDLEDPTIFQTFEAFGTLIFVFGAASLMPVIQNNRFKVSEFSTSLLIAFSLLTVLFITVLTLGFFFFGGRLSPNILMSLGSSSWATIIALILFTCHLFIATQIMLNPLCYMVETQTKAETEIQKNLIHLFLLLPMLLLSYYVQNVSFFTAIVGGSIVSIIIYVIPSIFYILLGRHNLNDWHERSMPLTHKIFSIVVIICGTLMSLVNVAIATAYFFDINLTPAQTYLD